MLNRPALEAALVLFGTTETDNPLNREFAEAGDAGQYEHITLAQELECVSRRTMERLAALPRGEGRSDWVNALLVRIALR